MAALSVSDLDGISFEEMCDMFSMSFYTEDSLYQECFVLC